MCFRPDLCFSVACLPEQVTLHVSHFQLSLSSSVFLLHAVTNRCVTGCEWGTYTFRSFFGFWSFATSPFDLDAVFFFVDFVSFLLTTFEGVLGFLAFAGDPFALTFFTIEPAFFDFLTELAAEEPFISDFVPSFFAAMIAAFAF